MTTDYTDQLTAQIERFDQMQARLGDGFADEVGNGYEGLTHTHQFEATLVDNPRIDAIADVLPNGSFSSVQLHTIEDGRVTQGLDVEQGSGLWRAMEVWMKEMAETWDGD